MDRKKEISARDTYVLDPDEISQLDGLSLTSIMRQVEDPLEQPAVEDRGSDLTTPSVTGSGDTTINELLRESEPKKEPKSDSSDSLESQEDLIDSKFLFRDEPRS